MNLDNQLIIIRNIDDIQDININNEDYIVIGVIGPAGPQGPRGIQGPRGPEGLQGPQGETGPAGRDGTDGVDGFSPIASVSQSGGVTTISITDKEGTTTASIDMNNYYTKDEVDNSQEAQDTQIEALQEENNYLNSIIDQLPKVSGEGEYITLNNTIEGKMSLELGSTELEQETTTGKNILDISNVTTGTTSGVTYKNNGDGTITFNGRATAQIYLNLNFTNNRIMLENGAKYSLGIKNSNSGVKALLRLVNPNVAIVVVSQGESEKLNITSNYSDEAFVFIQVDSGTTLNNFTIFPMVTKASTLGDYEKFTGNQASPNPSYPQQIHTISGDNEIVVSNKNLFDKNNANVYNGYFTPSAPTLTSNSNHRTIYIEIKPNTTYTIQKSNLGGDNARFGVGTTSTLPTTNVSVSQVTLNNTYLSQTITTDANAKYLVVWCYFTSNTAITFTDLLATIQIEYGSTATTYIEHKEQVKEINLGSLEYCKIGDYKDKFYLAKDTDTGLVSGKWYLKKNIGKVVLDGSEAEWDTTATNVFASGLGIIQANNYTCLSNYYKYNSAQTSVSSTLNDGEFAMQYNSPTTNRLFFKNTNISTVADWKTWLGTIQPIVYYVLITPTYTLLNDTLQEQINDIYYTMKSYKETTNISQVNNDLGFTIKASALLDLNTLIGGN